MPLQYDDIPGSWGTYSTNWPALRCANEHEAKRAYVACTKENLVPYGSYVLVDNDLRVESEALLEKLIDGIATSPFASYHEVMMHYEKSYREQYKYVMSLEGKWNYEIELRRRLPELAEELLT